MRRQPDKYGSVMPSPFMRGNNYNKPLCTGWERQPHRELRAGERQLGAFVLPPFQRPPVWTREQQVKFIESLWLRLPVGAYVVNYTNSLRNGAVTDCWLLDGQQRWTSILAYVAGEFEIYGYRYPDLPLVDRRGFDFNMPVPCIETAFETEEECREVYERLAYGGTPHDRDL